MHILGISAYYHDSAACLLRDGVIVAAAQEERFSRKKHDDDFPRRAIEYCLKEGRISARDLDAVAFYDKPFLKFERLLETYLAYAPRGLRSFLKAMPLWATKKLWIKDLIRKELGYNGRIYFPEHHLSHAASAFYPSPFASAAFITVDGVGEWTTTSWGIGEGRKLIMRADIHFPHSLGLLYSAFTYYLGFKVNSGEYKVMGLAPYGEPRYKKEIYAHLVDVKEDGSFRLNMEYFNYPVGLTMTNRKFHRLFGGSPRRPESRIEERHMDLARSLQEVTEEIVLKMARHVRKETGKRHLCLAGGVALNCVANAKIVREKIFDDVWIQPAAGDAGGALGAALLLWHEVLGKERTRLGTRDAMQGSYLGPAYSDEEIKSYLVDRSIPYELIDAQRLFPRVADLMANGNVVGWFDGRMEFGPRALGARSIIGDARNPEMQHAMNVKIKFRESFRPFAPAVLAEDASDYFDIDRPSPYMLLIADVVPHRRREQGGRPGLDRVHETRSSIPAVTHVDYSARLQTVHRETNPRFYALVQAMKDRHGVPVVINTSFNVRGEPIVCTPEDAYRCFMRTDMDYLVLGRFLLEKRLQPAWRESREAWQKEFELD